MKTGELTKLFHVVDDMDDDVRLRYYEALISLLDGNEPETDGVVKSALSLVRRDVESIKEKESRIAERNRRNGRKGGRPLSDDTERVMFTTFSLCNALVSEGVSRDTADAFIKARRKRGVETECEAVVDELRGEAQTSGLTLKEAIDFAVCRGWSHFKATWYYRTLRDNNNGTDKHGQSSYTGEESAWLVSKAKQVVMQ